jgi:glycosyltransferase involved in cell wall biosynthesis
MLSILFEHILKNFRYVDYQNVYGGITVEESPLISIIISTRNRHKYAISAITSILGISANDLELVVYDNSDSKELKKYIQNNIKDTRLRYKYISSPSPMTLNWDAAVGLASGKYICIIGDDDGINPEIIEATRWADMNNVGALKPTICVKYIWPESGVSSIRFTGNISQTGILEIGSFSGNIIKPDPEMELKKVIQGGGFRYLETEIPRLYHGIVKRKYLNEVREKTGAFFGGLSPDIFSAMAVANFAENVVSIDYPLTIAGISRSSFSAQSARGEHVGNLKDAPHLQYRSNYEWAEVVPQFYSVQTIWADSAVAALEALERNDILKDFNLPLLAAYCVAAHPKYTSIVLRDMYKYFQKNNLNQFAGTLRFCYSLLIGPGLGLVKLIAKGFRRILLSKDKETRFSGVRDTVEATNILTDYLRKNNKRFLDFVP